MLQATDIHVYYGDSHVLQGVSLEVRSGEIVCLLGRNGAGKSTTMRGLVGVNPPRSGRVLFNGREIAGRPVYENVRSGLAFVPEDRRIFAGLTVQENLEVAQLPARPGRPAWTFDRIYEVFPLLAPLKIRKGGNLSGGEQQMLAIARALVGNPALLLLDEPCEGLAPVIVQELSRIIAGIKSQIPILISEQNAHFALSIADRGYVIDKGLIRYEGSRQELLSNTEVQSRYLSV
ncbi:MAG: ABC transporter ATP-binding protein [Desulfobacterales bacterium]|jgi:branched-chain amino acid transport system ATP-binding protein|nr:ABC transporter ATP-binding protein [Desulfobacterales bacterium]